MIFKRKGHRAKRKEPTQTLLTCPPKPDDSPGEGRELRRARRARWQGEGAKVKGEGKNGKNKARSFATLRMTPFEELKLEKPEKLI